MSRYLFFKGTKRTKGIVMQKFPEKLSVKANTYPCKVTAMKL